MSEALPISKPERMAPHSNEVGRSLALAALLGRIEPALGSGIGSESPLVARLRVLRRRLEHEHLQIAVLGQFKRGKSTVINALLGVAALPTGVIPADRRRHVYCLASRAARHRPLQGQRAERGICRSRGG